MNKKLLSVAVATAIVAPTAAMADAILYGKAHVSLDYFDLRPDNVGFEGWTMSRGKNGKGNSRASRIGVKGSEDLTGGLKAIYQVELGVPLANESDHDIDDGDSDSTMNSFVGSNGGIKMRNSYVGLQGDFGTLLFGRHDTPYKLSTGRLELFNDTMADNEGTVGFHDVRADNTVAYMSPSWSGFNFAAAVVPGSASSVQGVPNDNSDGLAEGYSLAAMYSNGPWHASAAYEQVSDQLGTTLKEVGDVLTTGEGDEDFKKWRVGLGMIDMGGFTLTGIYEGWEGTEFKDVEASLWQIQTGYAFGNNVFKAMFGKSDFARPDEGARKPSKKAWAVGLDHNFSKRTKAYLLYTKVDTKDYFVDGVKMKDDWKGFSLGVMHDF